MSKSNSHNKLNTLSMVPENGRAEIHHPQPGGTIEQEKVVEDVPKSITEHQKGGMRGGVPVGAAGPEAVRSGLEAEK